MGFKDWLLTEWKFVTDSSAICILCDGHLLPKNLVSNSSHIYDLGISYSCKCNKSAIWTNSVRNEDNLIAFLNGTKPIYYNGFCNDLFCGKCFAIFAPIKNGYSYKGQTLDLYGCEVCDNKHVLMDISKNWAEGGESTEKLIQLYKNLLKQ